MLNLTGVMTIVLCHCIQGATIKYLSIYLILLKGLTQSSWYCIDSQQSIIESNPNPN